jgi:hypothetical protein
LVEIPPVISPAKAGQDFSLFLALAAILCSKAEDAGNLHN